MFCLSSLLTWFHYLASYINNWKPNCQAQSWGWLGKKAKVKLINWPGESRNCMGRMCWMCESIWWRAASATNASAGAGAVGGSEIAGAGGCFTVTLPFLPVVKQLRKYQNWLKSERKFDIFFRPALVSATLRLAEWGWPAPSSSQRPFTLGACLGCQRIHCSKTSISKAPPQ